MQKRIVPVLREPVPDERLHSEIRDRNWIPFTDDAEFDPSMGRLVKALDADLETARAHTRWLVKALEWDAEGRDKSFLLRGSELKAAEAMAGVPARGRRPGADAAPARVPARQPRGGGAPPAGDDGRRASPWRRSRSGC